MGRETPDFSHLSTSDPATVVTLRERPGETCSLGDHLLGNLERGAARSIHPGPLVDSTSKSFPGVSGIRP